MVTWLQLPEDQQRELLYAVGGQTTLPVNAIEKDWWVTLVLRACFNTSWGSQLVFKGGTSLSKAWQLVERFSEDIDLVLDREVLGFKGELSNTQIKKLRERSAAFTSSTFFPALQDTLVKMGVPPPLFRLYLQEGSVADRDPQILVLQYRSILETGHYLADKVLIEIGARSLLEPASPRTIHSIVGTTLPGQSFSGTPFLIPTVDPKRTFLEKMFLLHEEFAKPADKIRHARMSRHLYDLHCLMDTPAGQMALEDNSFYRLIIQHRAKYTPIRGLDYNMHSPQTLQFIPPVSLQPLWETDYALMKDTMIYGPAPSFSQLLERMNTLLKKVRAVSY
jgi:hypothetical protein